MQKYILVFMFVCLAGCGMSHETTRVEYGHVVVHTQSRVGFASAESTEERSTPLMERCLARVGALPNTLNPQGEEVDVAQTVCTNHVVKEIHRDDRQLDDEAEPYRGYYGLYGR